MSDPLTLLENELEKMYELRKEQLSRGELVPNWDDFNFRIGGLGMIREIGLLIKRVRNPEAPIETGEIPSVVEEPTEGQPNG